jgi:hypothetical protein
MNRLTDSPLLVFSTSLLILWLSAWLGAFVLGKHVIADKEANQDLSVLIAGSLTLLGLIIGFSFSMSVSRFDQRKNYEEAEANAIGTEYLRVDLLPNSDATKLRVLLQTYLRQRISLYGSSGEEKSRQINAEAAQTEEDLWSTARAAAAYRPDPLVALAVSGMNDVLNSAGYTDAAWRNRIPTAVWMFMAAVAILCNVMLGYLGRASKRRASLVLLPLLVAISFLLIADIDSPHGGLIRVSPQNLQLLLQAIR